MVRIGSGIITTRFMIDFVEILLVNGNVMSQQEFEIIKTSKRDNVEYWNDILSKLVNIVKGLDETKCEEIRTIFGLERIGYFGV